MPLIVIGSYALGKRIDEPEHNYIEITFRDRRKDLDLIGTFTEINEFLSVLPGNVICNYPIGAKKLVSQRENFPIVEAEIAWSDSSAELFMNSVAEDTETKKIVIAGVDLLVPSIDHLYLLKMSHRFLKNSPHFMKTMNDIMLLRTMDAVIRPEHQELLALREAETYSYDHPSLKVKKKDFFSGDNITYVYDHDSIHECMKHLQLPAYAYFKEDDQEVFCSRELFDQLPKKTKLYAVLEEAYVLALERSQIPYEGQIAPLRSFEIALQKICTSITSGWFREFAWEHYHEVFDMCDPYYLDKFKNGVKSGVVKHVSSV